MKLERFTEWLDGVLTPKMFADYCVDGLCVEAGSEVSRVITGVSFRDRLIDEAINCHADCIIVHHPNGFWKNESRVLVGKFGERMRRLIQHGISLYGYHLPLDAHPEIGNNAQIAKAIGLKVTDGFMREGEKFVACIGEFERSVSKDEFLMRVGAPFAHGLQHSFMYGSDSIRRVAVCSGAGGSGIDEAVSLGADALVTGEIKESHPIACEELRFNLVSAGHHRTEIFGVRALSEKIRSDLGIPATFVDIDNEI